MHMLFLVVNLRTLNRIHEMRWKFGITIMELSKKSGISKSAIHRIENGFVVPNQVQMIAIAKSLKMNVADVFDLEWRK